MEGLQRRGDAEVAAALERDTDVAAECQSFPRLPGSQRSVKDDPQWLRGDHLLDGAGATQLKSAAGYHLAGEPIARREGAVPSSRGLGRVAVLLAGAKVQPSPPRVAPPT